MKEVIKIEEFTMFMFGIWLFSRLHFEWWWFPVLLLAPDISMVGYAINNRTGAIMYNIFHHKGVAVFLYLLGIYLGNELVQLTGVILFAHSSMDRIFGYGLKYFSGFKQTHLGEIGKNNE